MTEYRRRFGDKECRIEVEWENGTCLARLFTLEQEQSVPILSEFGEPTVLTATTPAWAYQRAVQFLTTRFGPEVQ